MRNCNRMGLAAFVALGLLATPTAQAQMGHGEDRETMMERCQAMKERMQAMHDRIQTMDRELEEAVEAMEESEGDAKIEAMEAAIRRIADHHREMYRHRQQMIQRMMSHMGDHMMMKGNEQDRHEMMMRCPMMSPANENQEGS